MAIEQLTEQLALVGCIDPDVYNTGTQATDVIDMALHYRCFFTVMAGDLGNAGTLDFTVQESPTGVGAWTALAPVKSITQLTAVGGDDDSQALVEVLDDEMNTNNLDRYLRGVMTVSGNAVDAGVVAFANRCRYKPSILQDLASVVEIVA